MAFTALVNTPIVSLVALLPVNNLALSAVVLACTCISSAIGLTVVSLRVRAGSRHLLDVVIIPVLRALYVLQLFNGAACWCA